MAQKECPKTAKIAYDRVRREKFRPSDRDWFPSSELLFKPPLVTFEVYWSVPEVTVEAQMPRVLDALQGWVYRNRGHYCKEVPPKDYQKTGKSYQLFDTLVQDSNGAMSVNLGPLQLAISVFQTKEGQTMIGREVCSTWKDDLPDVQFSEAGAASAKATIKLVRANRLITPEEMDEKDRRFVCLNCHTANGGSWEHAKAHTWRTAVSRFFTNARPPYFVLYDLLAVR